MSRKIARKPPPSSSSSLSLSRIHVLHRHGGGVLLNLMLRFLDEASLFQFEEAYPEILLMVVTFAAAGDNDEDYDGSHQSTLVQWRYLAQLDDARALSRWRPTTPQDEQSVDAHLAAISTTTKTTATTATTSSLQNRHRRRRHLRDDLLARCRGRDFGRSVVFVQSCQKQAESYHREHDNIEDDSVNDEKCMRNFAFHAAATAASAGATVSHDRRSFPSPIQLSTTNSIHLEQYWREWFQATRSEQNVWGTYAFVRVALKKAKGNGDAKTQTNHDSLDWQGFRRLIWASWMDHLILDIHLIQLVHEMGWQEMDEVLEAALTTITNKGNERRNPLLTRLQVTIAVSGTILVVTGGLHSWDCGFIFCHPREATHKSIGLTVIPLSVELSPDSFYHEVNIRVDLHRDRSTTTHT